MKTKFLTGLVFLAAVACSGGQTTRGDEPGGQSVTELKKAAAEAAANGSAQGDVCGTKGWYGDGECDTFCQDADAVDCVPDPGGVHCAEFIEQPNGYCSRTPSDPCISQDPDCKGTPDDPIVCTLISELPDGVCKADPTIDLCAFYQDPDCQGATDPGTPDDPIICPAIAELPDGACQADPTTNPCGYYQDPDCSMGGGVPSDPGTPICKAVPENADGTCSREPSDPCLALDPDCVPDVACAEYIELSDGVCKRDPADPCIFQDPDCAQK